MSTKEEREYCAKLCDSGSPLTRLELQTIAAMLREPVPVRTILRDPTTEVDQAFKATAHDDPWGSVAFWLNHTSAVAIRVAVRAELRAELEARGIK